MRVLVPLFYTLDMKRLMNFAEFVNESYVNEAKHSADFGYGAKTLMDLKAGDFVWKEMQRYNPQLGTYYTFSKAKIFKITGKKIFLDSYGEQDDNFYDRGTGEQLKTSRAAYGSAWYSLLTHEEALAKVSNDTEGKYKKYGDAVKNLSKADAEQFCLQNVRESRESLLEGAVKQFEMGMTQLINNVKTGYGWIDPSYVEDTFIMSSDFEGINFDDVKDEVFSRLIKANLLYYSSPDDPEQMGKRVTSIKQIEESRVNESTPGYTNATINTPFEDLKVGDVVKIDALDFTKRGDDEKITCIDKSGAKLEILKKYVTVKL